VTTEIYRRDRGLDVGRLSGMLK